MEKFVGITVGFFLFAIFHSVFAALPVQQTLERRLGRLGRCYRLMYNVLSIAFIAILVWLFPPTGEVLYSVPPPYNYLMRLVQFFGVVMFAASLTGFSQGSFLGLHCLSKRARPPVERLNTGGLYRYCRHPMYTASMLYLLFQPTMNVGLLAYTINILLYFWIGSIFEERRLLRIFGEEYERYRRQVPKFIPRLSLKSQ